MDKEVDMRSEGWGFNSHTCQFFPFYSGDPNTDKFGIQMVFGLEQGI
jgi:hypothetical protein